MKVLFDIAHPAHVHFYRCLMSELEAEGHSALVVARDKEMTLALLQQYGIPYHSIGRAGRSRRLQQAAELLHRDWALWRLGRDFRPDVILTRNPAGIHAARLLGVTGIWDTCDGRAARLHFRAAAPLASVITSPDSMPEDYGKRHQRYPGYNALAFLHPNRFAPDSSVLADLGIGDEPLFILRFVANNAAHDKSSIGIPDHVQRELVRRLGSIGRVLISSESPLSPDLRHYQFELQPTRIHDVLAASSLYIGDSGAMAAEAAVLGTPAIRLSSWTGPDNYLKQLSDVYGLVHLYGAGETQSLLAKVDEIVADLTGAAQRASEGRTRMLQDKEDVTTWYRRLLDRL